MQKGKPLFCKIEKCKRENEVPTPPRCRKIKAINITRRWKVNKRIIMTDSLSYIVAQKEIFTKGNSKKMVLKDLMAE
jgi:hypothetical protein